MSLSVILIVAAAVFFALEAFRVSGPVSWTPAGFCFLTIALFLL
jgi:hypothetical protein